MVNQAKSMFDKIWARHIVSPETADTLCSLARSTLLHFGYEGRIATAGNLAFPFSPSDLRAGEVYEFSLYHLLETDPLALFPLTVEELG